jgi:hypothetical protein
VRLLTKSSAIISPGPNRTLPPSAPQRPHPALQENRIALAWCFLRVINLTDDAFERLGRYEAALWRQVRQTLFSLEGLRLGRSAKRYRRPHHRWTSRADMASGEDISEDSSDR